MRTPSLLLKFLSGSFCVREGVCSFEGGTWGMWSCPWRACSALGMNCYLEGLLARGGATHCILLAPLPSIPDGDEHGGTRTVSTWCSASSGVNSSMAARSLEGAIKKCKLTEIVRQIRFYSKRKHHRFGIIWHWPLLWWQGISTLCSWLRKNVCECNSEAGWIELIPLIPETYSWKYKPYFVRVRSFKVIQFLLFLHNS